MLTWRGDLLGAGSVALSHSSHPVSALTPCPAAFSGSARVTSPSDSTYVFHFILFSPTPLAPPHALGRGSGCLTRCCVSGA